MASNIRYCATVAAVVLVLAGVPAISQTSQGPETPSGIRITGDEVLLNLSVHGKSNKTVLDLKQDEIAITDNGEPVQLTGFRLVAASQGEAPMVTLLFDRPGIQPISKSNSDDPRFGMTDSSSAEERSNTLRKSADKFLKSLLVNGSIKVAVMDVWGRLQLQQEFTRDPAAIKRAVSMAVQPGVLGSPVISNATEETLSSVAQTGQDVQGNAASVRDRAIARSMLFALQASVRISQDQHVPPSMGSLMALVQAQQQLPGRKAIVYFTSEGDARGNPIETVRNDSRGKEVIRSIAGLANRAGLSIYIVRASGLNASNEIAALLDAYSTLSIGSADIMPAPQSKSGPEVTALQAMQAGQFASKSEFKLLASKQSAVHSNEDGLNALAKNTGGAVIEANENLTRPVQDLVGDLTTYYEASYPLPGGVEDGSFHATAVKVLRPNLNVRTRTGYVALPPGSGISQPPQPYELPLMALLRREKLPTEVNIRAAILNMGHQGQNSVNTVVVDAPMDGLEVREDTSTHLASAHISVLTAIRNSDGALIEQLSEDIARRWPMSEGAGNRPEVLSFQRTFSAPPGRYLLETAVIDHISGRASASRQPFEIQAATNLPELSDLVLVRSTEALAEEDGSNPLRYGGNRVQPNLFGELRSGARTVSVFFLAHIDPHSIEPAFVTLEVSRNGVPLEGNKPASLLQGVDEFHSIMNTFAISAAPAGKYQLRATLEQGNKFMETTREFTLTGDEGRGTEVASTAPLLADPPAVDVPTQGMSQVDSDFLELLLADARRNAMDYRDALPNLICQQTTTRSIDSQGNGNWRHKDTRIELLTYVDHQERRSLVSQEVNNEKISVEKGGETGMTSAGEFGGSLSGIFSEHSKAEFKWTESAMLRGEAVEVFEYSVMQANSTFSLLVRNGVDRVGYHGKIYIDRATHGVRSVTLVTDEASKNFPIRKAAVRIDYDYVAINDHDYLLPVSAQVVVGQGRKTLERNNLEFTNFRRFGSTLRIVANGVDTAAQ